VQLLQQRVATIIYT